MTKYILNLSDLPSASIVGLHTIEIDLTEVLARQGQIAIIWSIADVLQVRPDLTPDQAWDVLIAVDLRQNYEYGVSWNTLQFWAEALFATPVGETGV